MKTQNDLIKIENLIMNTPFLKENYILKQTSIQTDFIVFVLKDKCENQFFEIDLSIENNQFYLTFSGTENIITFTDDIERTAIKSFLSSKNYQNIENEIISEDTKEMEDCTTMFSFSFDSFLGFSVEQFNRLIFAKLNVLSEFSDYKLYDLYDFSRDKGITLDHQFLTKIKGLISKEDNTLSENEKDFLELSFLK